MDVPDEPADDGDVPREAIVRPADFASLREEILRRRARLPKRLAQVAAFVVASPDEIAFGTAAAVAAHAGVQPSTLVRFGQAFGYAGFSDLQAAFRDRLRDRVPSYGERLAALRAPDGSVPRAAVLLDGFTDAALRSLEAARERTEGGRLDDAVARLAAADTIHLVGQRRSYPATASMSYLLGTLGIRHVLGGSPLGTDAETLALARPVDAAVVVSFTPYAPAVVAAAEALGRAGVPCVVVTDNPFSPIRPPGAIRFEIAETDFQGFRPLVATMTLLMTLALGVAEHRAGPSGSPVRL